MPFYAIARTDFKRRLIEAFFIFFSERARIRL